MEEFDLSQYNVIFYCPVASIVPDDRWRVDTYLINDKDCCVARMVSAYIKRLDAPLLKDGKIYNHVLSIKIECVTSSFAILHTDVNYCLPDVNEFNGVFERQQKYVLSIGNGDFNAHFKEIFIGFVEIVKTITVGDDKQRYAEHRSK